MSCAKSIILLVSPTDTQYPATPQPQSRHHEPSTHDRQPRAPPVSAQDCISAPPHPLQFSSVATTTGIRPGEGKLYLCAVKDVFSNRIVGYVISDRMKASLAVAALQDAINRRKPAPGLTVHSDRGSQFRSEKFRHLLSTHGLIQSMGAVGTCADIAAMESFFNLVQTNVLDRHKWATRQQLRLPLVRWINGTYNRRRRHRALGKLTPLEYEITYQPTATAT